MPQSQKLSLKLDFFLNLIQIWPINVCNPESLKSDTNFSVMHHNAQTCLTCSADYTVQNTSRHPRHTKHNKKSNSFFVPRMHGPSPNQWHLRWWVTSSTLHPTIECLDSLTEVHPWRNYTLKLLSSSTAKSRILKSLLKLYCTINR